MQSLKFKYARTLFISLFVLVQFDFMYSQILFPNENNINRPPNGGRYNNNYNNYYTRPYCMYREYANYCVTLERCPQLSNSRDYNLIRQSFCGFAGNQPKVCCPPRGPSPNNNGYPNNNNGYPNNNNGYPNNNNGYPNNNNGYPNNNNNNNGYPNNDNNNNGYPSNDYSTQPPVSSDLVSANDFTYPRRLPQTCGISTRTTNRIVGGSVAIPGAWPWMVSLQQGKGERKSHTCGAALISENTVVTAAHCVKNEDGSTIRPEMLAVRLGEHNIEEDSPEDAAQQFEIAQVIPHQQYNDKFLYDIAVLKLKGNVRFNDRISPVCLPYDSKMIRTTSLTGRSAIISGWGATGYGDQGSKTLLQATLKIVNPEFCKQKFERYMKITEEYMCAGSEQWNKDSCQGDSGGPLTMFDPDKKRWYLVGVVSFGKKCASNESPGVYTRVSFPKTLAWLNQNF